MFSIHGLEISFREKTIFEAKSEIEGVIFDDSHKTVIICHDSNDRTDNLVCINEAGEEVWRMEGQENIPLRSLSPYTFITVSGGGEFWVYCSNGNNYHFDPENGNILDWEWIG